MLPRENPRPEAPATFGTKRVAAMFQAFQGAQRTVEKPDPEAHRANFLMEFLKLKPPVFKGLSDPVAAERWLKKMKRSSKNWECHKNIELDLLLICSKDQLRTSL